MKKLLLASLLLSILAFGGKGGMVYAQDDGSWINRRPPYSERLNMSAQEVLNLMSRKLTPGATPYIAMEVVSSQGNFKVTVTSMPPVTVTLSTTNITVNLEPGSTVYIANPAVISSTVSVVNPVTIQYGVQISTWHEFVITSATNASLFPTSFMTYLAVFSVISDGGGGTLDTNFGTGMRLLDGVGKVSPRFDVPISSPTITMTGLSTAATYYIDVFGSY
jgi:hypothetical protein